jgi:VWFA-related protein
MRLAQLTLPVLILALTLPATAAESNAPLGQSPQPATPTIQVYSRETIVDILVTDGHGQPVHGLSRSDFAIREDGKPQPIRSFGEFGAATNAAYTAPALPSGIHTNLAAAPTAGPVNIILIDALHSGWISAARALQATSAYASRMKPGTQLAVYWLSVSGLHLLQGFTTDPAQIRQAVALEREDLGTSNNCYQTDRMTIDALNQIAAYVAGVKGRKNLLWFTPGMPVYLLRDGGYGWGTTTSCRELNPPQPFGTSASDGMTLFTSAGGTEQGIDMTEVHRIMDTYELFTTEQIAVSPIGPGGVRGLGMADLVAESVAEQSGGIAEYNNNDLPGEIDDAISAGSHYYTISYVPPRQKDDSRFHAIKIDVDRPGLHLVYRSGYNAEDPRAPKPYVGPALIKAALQGRAPSATQLLFDAKLEPTPAPSEGATSADAPSKLSLGGPATSTPPTRKPSKTPTRTPYDLYIAVPQSQIAYAAGADGTHAVKLQFAFDAYDLNGKLLGDHSQDLTLDLTPDRYQRFIQKPVLFHALLMFYPGPIYLRVGVLDNVANKVGTLEIPLTIPKK